MISSALPINVSVYYFGMSEKTEKREELSSSKMVLMQFPFTTSEAFLLWEAKCDFVGIDSPRAHLYKQTAKNSIRDTFITHECESAWKTAKLNFAKAPGNTCKQWKNSAPAPHSNFCLLIKCFPNSDGYAAL